MHLLYSEYKAFKITKWNFPFVIKHCYTAVEFPSIEPIA